MKKTSPALIVLILSTLACGLFQSGPGQMGPTAKPVWENAASAKPNSYTYANGIFYALGSQLVAFDETTGKVLWQAAADTYRLSQDQQLVYVSTGGDCASLDAASGKTVKSIPADQAYLCDPTHPDDSPYTFTLNDDGSVSASDVSTGAALWTTPLGLTFSSIYNNPAGAAPYAWRGHVIVYTSTFQPGDANIDYLNFQVLDPSSGKPVWALTGKPKGMAIINGDAVILAYQDAFKAQPTTSTSPIPVPTGPFQLAARDLATGKERWHVVTEYAEGYYDTGNLLYQCNAGNWRWFDLQTGKLLGEQKGVAASYIYSCPVMGQQGSPNVEVGQDVWLVRGTRTSADNPNFENPIQDGWYTAFQVSTGKALWSTEIVIHSTPSIVALGKSMVLMVQDNKLRAYRLSGK